MKKIISILMITMVCAVFVNAQKGNKKYKLTKVTSMKISAKTTATLKKYPKLAKTLRKKKNTMIPAEGYAIYKIEGTNDFLVMPSKIDISSFIQKSETYRHEFGGAVFWFTCSCPDDESEETDKCKVIKDGQGNVNVTTSATACSGTCGERACALSVSCIDAAGNYWFNGEPVE